MDKKTVSLVKKRWAKVFKQPGWYLTIAPEWNALKEKADQLPEEEKTKLKEEAYDFIESLLNEDKIALGNEAGNWDKERRPIDTIVIHHTSAPPGMTPSHLSAIELIRLYAPYYANPSEEDIKGKPISSGHIRSRKQVFWPYHWLIRTDGTVEHLLNDDEIGWQAGNWEINCRSIAICFDNTYTDSRPSDGELEAAAKIIRNNYSSVSKERILGHCEVYKQTVCPSNQFLSIGDAPGWKDNLLSLI